MMWRTETDVRRADINAPNNDPTLMTL